MTANGPVSKRADCWMSTLARWASSTQLLLGNVMAWAYQSCLEWMQAYERDKTQGTCQLVRVVQSFVKTISEPECLTLRQVVQLRDILSDTSHKITAKTPVTRLHASSLMFCQENQWARMSNFETGCPTSRHTVWYFTQDHCQDARNKIACKPSHLLSRTSAEPGRLTLRQAVQTWDILSDVETYFTQDHCQEALTRVHASSHVLSGQSVSQNVWLWDRLSNFETYCLILRLASHKITAKTPVTRLCASSLVFCQEYQSAGCLTLRQRCGNVAKHHETVTTWIVI